MITVKQLKHWLKPVRNTPLHPQWLMTRSSNDFSELLQKKQQGILLDIGCGNSQIKKIVRNTVTYIGLDYPKTMALGYDGAPDILGDASWLPFADASIDTAIMFDVLEHIANPELAIAEVSRVLSTGGHVFIKIPFLYPLHDEPHDYQRLTRHGLIHMLKKHDLQIEEISEQTSPVETSALLMNIALAKGLIDSVQEKSPAILTAPFIIGVIPLINIFGWAFAKILPSSKVMPVSYFIDARKGR